MKKPLIPSFFLILVLFLPTLTNVALTIQPVKAQQQTAPEITSVSPIYTVQTQTITIQGNGFGNIQPQLMNLGDGSVDTVWSGSTPSLVLLDTRNNLSAGAAGGWSGFTNGSPDLIGVVLVSWTDTQIVLGGFGSGLGSRFSWSQVMPGDVLQIQIQTVGGLAMNNTIVTTSETSGSILSPTSSPTPSSVPTGPNQSDSSFTDDFSSDTHAWQYLGSAYRDAGNQCMVLTTDSYSEGGAALFNVPIQGSFTVNFHYKAGEGNWGGDGFTMFFYKQEYSNLDDGGSLAFSAKDGITHQLVPGYGIEFDSWQNIPEDFQQFAYGQQNPQGDPSSHHIVLIKDFAGDHLAYVDDTRVDDNAWHQVTVQVQGSSVSVSVDNGLVLQWTGEINRTFDCFGFSGATGCATGWQLIDDFSITAQNLHTAALTTNCISATASQTFNVYTISGDLTSNGDGISGAPIYVSYSVTGGESWQDLTLVYTSSDGKYSAIWLPTVTGNYQLKTVYKGSENYLGARSIISFSIQPSNDQTVFSITSNSTITCLSFNPDSRQLSFNVSGDSGSTGFAYVFIPKSLLNDTADLNVNLDGNQIDYTAQSQNDGWLLYLTYHHSTHVVTVNLGSSVSIATGKSASQYNASNFIFAIVTAAIATFAAVLVIAFRTWKKSLTGKKL